MALQDNVHTLVGLPAFRELPPDAVRLIAFSAETRILRAGDVLFRRGEASDGGYVVLSGAVGLQGGTGHEVPVRAPALLGDMALVAPTERPATATAREPTSVLKVTRALYCRILAEYPDSAVRIRAAAAARLFAMQAELDGLRQRMTG